jgi:hypothetical protein
MSHKVNGVEEATKYLEEDGGLEEIIEFASNLIMNQNQQPLQLNAETALALCCLAAEGKTLRMRVRLAAEYK